MNRRMIRNPGGTTDGRVTSMVADTGLLPSSGVATQVARPRQVIVEHEHLFPEAAARVHARRSASVGVSPALHDSRTFEPGANPVPVAMVTIPGGPTSGSILSLPCRTTGACFPDPDSRLVRGELEKAYGTASVAVRAPDADGVNDTRHRARLGPMERCGRCTRPRATS